MKYGSWKLIAQGAVLAGALLLGDSRANALKAALVQAGVSPDRIRTVSYGKEKPFCTVDDEQCWQSNRRDHLTAQLHQ